ncbi:LLM class flavin-dependent oxidoreductase [Leptospira sp. GIMC2001]|uniref:LLM class flavin-dependent oxidoreductase n=1 Tax=Leptospira sp. GIMC2001 TaxID=1513297 RepID=UPI00234A5351|nr:LLM class flavin-dependent oxidoreductase [Leptospira sp. GIMC2001]WCL50926.1 LLM class flavin-dependent oxidoreductase [Leptospira sp. GIMC2001]
MSKKINIRTEEFAAEIAWFCDLCNGDYEFLGEMDGKYRSSFENCKNILLKADELGFGNILLPSSYQVGMDVLSFASAVAPMTKNISLLTALRCGEVHPPMLARAISTLDHILQGRLTINIISSDLPGTKSDSETRYNKSREVIEILKQGWNQEEIRFEGKYYNIHLPSDPVKSYQQNGGPLLYFGGISEDARNLCAEHCDVFLMWPETLQNIEATMADLSNRANQFNRNLDYGLRIHMIVRETEKEAREYANRLMSKLDMNKGQEIKSRSLDSKSLGVIRQDELRKNSDSDGFIEENIWSGIGLVRSGCGSAIVGDPDQVLAKIKKYMDLGIRSFIFSGYPLNGEIDYVSQYILPKIQKIKLSEVQKRTPNLNEIPITPLTNGVRK